MGFLNDYNNRRNKRKDEEEERQRDSVSSFGKRVGREEKTDSSFMSQLGNVSKDVFRTETPSTNPYDIALETARNSAQPETNTGFMERPSVFEPTGYSDDELNTIEQNLLNQRSSTTMSGAPDFSNLGAGIGENNNKEFDATSFNSYVNNVSNRKKTYDNPLDNYGVDKNVVDLTQFDPDTFKNDMEDLANKETDTGNNWWDTIKNIDEGLKDVREKKDINYYNSLADADDFAEMSQYQKVNKPLGNYSDAEWTSYALNEIRGDQADINIMRDLGEYKYATADEVDTFNYLYNTQGADAAMDFYKRLNLSGRMTETATDYAAQAAEAHPVIASAESFVASPIKGIGYIGSALDVLSGKGLDPNAWYNLPSNIQNSIRSQVSNDIIKNADNEFMGKVGSFMYQTGMSMGDFLMNLGTGSQELSLGIMGAGAASDSVIEAKKRGLSDAQALATGTIAGLAEIVSENVSIESLFNSNAQGVKYILQNFIAEGAEEVESDLINDVADLIINGDKAQMKQAYQQYLDEGLSESEAFGRMIGDQAIQYGTDFLGGAISGGIMGSVGAAGQYVNQRNIGNTMLSDEQSLNQIVNLGAQSENEETRALAQQVFDGNAKKNVIGELVQKVSSENNLYGKIIDNLRESGETQGMAEAEADAIMNHISGAELTGQDQEYLNKENVQNALNDVFGGTYDTAYANSEAANDAYSRALEMARQQRAEKMAPVTNAINNVRNIFGNKKSGAQNNTETENNAQVSEENTQKAEETESQEAVKNIPLSERAKIGADISKFRTEVKPVQATLNDVKAVEVTPDGLSVTLNDGQKVNTHQIMDDATRYMLQRVERNFNDTQGAEDYIKAYNKNVNTTVFNNAAFQMNTAGYNGVDYKTAYNNVTKDASFVANGQNIPESFLQDMYAYGKRERDRVSKEMNSKIQKVVTDSIEKFVGITSHEGGEEGQGYYDPKTNEITYGKYTKQSRIETLAHELTHMMRKHVEGNYNQIKDIVLEVLKSGGQYDQIFEDTKKTYTDLDEDGIIEEIVANSMQEMLFNKTVINELCEKKPDFAHRIWNAIKKAIAELRNVLRGHIGSTESKILSQDIEALEKAAKLYAQGLKQMSENMKNVESKEGEIKYSQNTFNNIYEEGRDFSFSLTNRDYARLDKMIKTNPGEETISGERALILDNKLIYNKDNKITCVITATELDNRIPEFTENAYLKGMILHEKDKRYKGASRRRISDSEQRNVSNELGGKLDVFIDYGRVDIDDRILGNEQEGNNGKVTAGYFANKQNGKRNGGKSRRSQTQVAKNVKHSYAGLGSVNADMTSLTEAINMLEEGKSKEEVFRETGWFQGADEKWRYEISDDAMKVFPKGDAKYLNDNEYQRYEELENRFFYGDSNLSKDELKEFDDLFNKFLNRKVLTVDDVVKHDKLFDAYPFLKDIKIDFVKPDKLNGAIGKFDKSEGKILVDLYSKARPNDLKSIIIHEIQHAIQNWEHYAGGASPSLYSGIYSVIDSHTYAEYKDADFAIKRLLDKAPEEFKEKYKKLPELYFMYSASQNEKYINEAHEIEENLEANYKDIYDEISELEADKKFYEGELEQEVTPEELYRITAGEIEARDTENRLNLSEEERKEKYPTRTSHHKVYVKETGKYLDDRQMKFSLEKPVEINRDLIAAHNISEENLLKTLKLGGFPMPSIAVTKAEYNPDNFGTISVLFDKNSIDPKVNKANKGYFGDAWTPTVPRTVKKINNKKLNALHNKLGLSGDYSSVFQDDMEDIVRRLSNEEQVKEKFIKDNNVEIEKKPYTKWHHPRTAQIFDILKDSTHTMYSIWTDEALKKQLAEAAYPESKLSFVKKAREKYLEMLNHIDDSSEKLDEFLKDKDDAYVSTYMNLYQDLFDIVHDQVRSGWDRNAYREDVDKYISEHEEEFKKFIEDAINEADMYEGEYFRKPGVDEITNNGRRSFEQLHIPYNAENMLKLMLKDKNAIKGFFGGASNLRGAITKEYKSIEDIKRNEGKLNKVQAEEVDAKLSELNHIIIEIDNAIKDVNGWSGWVADDDINETLVKLLKKPKITLDVANSVFAKDETKFAPEIIDEVIELKKGLQELPVQYFEAKPERVIGFDEIKATIIPDDSSVELKEALDKAGIPYEEYKAGDKEDRLEKLNSHEDLKFSLQDDWDFDWEAAMAESEEEKIAEGMVAQNDVNILEDGFRALKDIKDAGKVNISHNKAVQIAKRYTEKYDSATGAESLATSIEAVFAYIREHDVSYDDMLRVMRDVTLPVVENIRGDEQFTEEYRDFVKSLKGTSISLNESQKKEVAYAYGSLTNFRKAVAGRFNISDSGVNIDSLWPEIVEQSGYRLDEEENSNSQPIALLELLDQMKSDKGTVNRGMSDNQLALDMALNIYTDCFKEMSMNAAKVNETEVAKRLAETKEILKDTVAKYEDAVDKMYKQMLADTKARAQAEIDRLTQELRELNNIDTYNRSIDTDKRIVQLKRQIDRLKQQQEEERVYRKTSRQKARENRENSRMRNAIKSIVKDLSSRLTNPNKNRYVPEEDRGLVQATIDMLESINLDTKEGNLIKEKVQKVKDAYERLGKSTNESDASDDYDPALYNMITRLKEIFDKGKSVRRLSQSELEDVLTIAKAIQTQVKNANELIKSEIAQKIDETARGVIEDVRANKEIGNGWLEDLANRGVNTVLDPRRFLNRLVGYNEDSKMMQLFDELNEGQHKMMQIQMETSEIFNGILENETEARKLTGENEEDWVETPFKDKKGNPLKIPVGMRLSLAMHMENEDNLKHIIYGGLTVPDMKLYNQGRKAEAYKKAQAEIRLIDDNTRLKLYEMRDKANELNDEKYTNQEREDAWAKYRDTVKKAEDQAKAKLQSIVDGMTDYERQFIEYAKEYFWNYSGKQINETSMALNGYMKATVENYFPIATDTNYSKRDIEGLKLDQTLEGWGNLKSRVHAKNPIFLENIVDVISKHSDMMSKYAGLAIPIRNFNKVYNYNLRDNGSYKDSVMNAINSQRGAAATEYIENLLTDLQGSRKGFTGKIGEGLEKLRGNFAAATLTANLGVAIKQAASIYTAADVLGHDAIAHVTVGTNAAKHFWGSFTHVHKLDDYIVEQMEEIKKYSPLVWYRNQGNSTQELKDLKNKKTVLDKFAPTRFAKDLTGNWIQNIDTATVTTLWEAAKYRISKDTDLEYGSEEYFKEVAKIFNKAVEQTQPNYTTLQRPDILRNPNELVRNVIMFATQPIQNLGICVDSTANYLAKYEAYKNNQTEENKAKLDIAGKRLARSLSAVAVSMLVFSLMSMVAKAIRHKVDDYRDENGEITFESVMSQIFKDFGSSVAGMVPLGSEIYDYWAAKLTGGKYYGFEVSTIKMVTDFLGSVGKMCDSMIDLVFKGDTEKLGTNTKNFIFNTASMAGVPAKNIYNLVNGLWLMGQDVKKLVNGEPWFFESGYTRSNTVNQNRLYEAMISGGNDKFDDVYAEMLQNGLTPDKIYGGSGSAGLMVKDDLLNGNIDVNTAVDYLEKLGAENASEKVAEWVKDDTKEKFEAGTIDSEEAEEALMEAGMGANDAHFKVQEWETGSTSDYIGVINAISSGDPKDIVDAVNEMLEYGYDKEKLKSYSGITSNFKEQYIDLYHTNKTEAASLKSAILTYYQACGMSREDAAKKVDKWVE
jgi:hypothetical protein